MLAAPHVGLECVLVAAYHVAELTIVVARFALFRDCLLLLETLFVVLPLKVSLVRL